MKKSLHCIAMVLCFIFLFSGLMEAHADPIPIRPMPTPQPMPIPQPVPIKPMPTPESIPTPQIPSQYLIPYNREAVISYAQRWAAEGERRVNPKYERFDYDYWIIEGGGDCANFVSQALHESGIPMNDEWFYRKKKRFWGLFSDSEYSQTWTVAHKHFEYFSDPNNGYMEGEVITITSPEQIDQLHKKGIVKPGDLLYWDFLGDGHIRHATLITDVNGSIKYSGHTRDTYNSDLRSEYELTTMIVKEEMPEAQPKLHIVRMRDRIPSKPVDYK